MGKNTFNSYTFKAFNFASNTLGGDTRVSQLNATSTWTLDIRSESWTLGQRNMSWQVDLRDTDWVLNEPV